MSPFKGQGANQALLDAVLLARVIYRLVYEFKNEVKKVKNEVRSISTTSTLISKQTDDRVYDDDDERVQRNIRKILRRRSQKEVKQLLPHALAWFEREMLERSRSKVEASANAAKYLHSPLALLQEDNMGRATAYTNTNTTTNNMNMNTSTTTSHTSSQ
jgi:hypothetical protein